MLLITIGIGSQHILDNQLGLKGPAHICIMNNVYGYKSNDGKLKFKAYCKQKLNTTQKEFISNLKKSYNSTDPKLVQYALYLDIIHDQYPRNKSYKTDIATNKVIFVL